VQLQTSTTLGKYLVDQHGYALYFFSKDVAGQSNCTGGCETTWPVLQDSNLTASEIGTGLKLSDFNSIKTSEGKTQLTYKGWPLYRYSPGGTQEATGMTGGDGIGGIWFVAKPDYTFMLSSTQWVGGDGNDYTTTYVPGAQGNTVYITDAQGATLYTFYKDSANNDKFTKSDFSNDATWPIYDTTSIVVPSVINKNLIGTYSLYGRTQVTYNGWPLYHFGSDSLHRGVTKGASVGPGKWPILVQNLPAAPHQ
jgi:predicted lipoprotein with Yx(FWY)xxD motif